MFALVIEHLAHFGAWFSGRRMDRINSACWGIDSLGAHAMPKIWKIDPTSRARLTIGAATNSLWTLSGLSAGCATDVFLVG